MFWHFFSNWPLLMYENVFSQNLGIWIFQNKCLPCWELPKNIQLNTVFCLHSFVKFSEKTLLKGLADEDRVIYFAKRYLQMKLRDLLLTKLKFVSLKLSLRIWVLNVVHIFDLTAECQPLCCSPLRFSLFSTKYILVKMSMKVLMHNFFTMQNNISDI